MAIIAAGIAEPDDNRDDILANGRVVSFVDEGKKIGVMVEMNCQSEFVAQSEQFQQLAHAIAHHIAEADPKFIRKGDALPNSWLNKKSYTAARELPLGSQAAS